MSCVAHIHQMKLMPCIKIATFIQETALPEAMERLVGNMGKRILFLRGNNLQISL